MAVDPGFLYIERFHGGFSWYLMESKEFTSDISSILTNGNGSLVSFNGQSITSRISIKKCISFK